MSATVCVLTGGPLEGRGMLATEGHPFSELRREPPAGVGSIQATAWQFDPPHEVLESRIFNNGGYFVVSGLFDEATLAGLQAEAESSRLEGQRQCMADSDGSDGRGGCPARAFRSGAGQALHWALHLCPEMIATLSNLCGATISAIGSGNYSYYEEAGDFIALHRDILQCDITLITALTPAFADGRAGELTVYPEFIREPLSAVRSAGRAYGRPVVLDRGHTAVLLGGMVPHEVTPTCPGQERIVAINCYRIEEAAPEEDRLETPACK